MGFKSWRQNRAIRRFHRNQTEANLPKRLDSAKSIYTDLEVLRTLATDASPQVRQLVASNSSITKDVVKLLIEDVNQIVRFNLAQRLDLSEESVTAGAQITVEATGYAPNAEFALWLRSDPVFIGRGVANRFGEIKATFAVPKNIPLGDHKIELNGLTKKKEVRSVAVPATVIKYTNPGNIELVTENPVEKYLNGLSALMSMLFIVLMVGVWAVGATIRDQRLLRARIRN